MLAAALHVRSIEETCLMKRRITLLFSLFVPVCLWAAQTPPEKKNLPHQGRESAPAGAGWTHG